ncbi:MAG: hypothetical protein Kow0068_13380 [Marinilabiliales bacterium]
MPNQSEFDDIKIYIDSCNKLGVFDWLYNIKTPPSEYEFVEVRFKNTRKDFYLNENKIKLKPGDFVAVEANPGHDIGIVSLTGELVMEQMKKHNISVETNEFKKIYRKARQNDIEKWKEAIKLENGTMLRARQIAKELKLDMKIGDVEYQGDKTKAIFYYIADERVDFRTLIKKLAEEFRVRIEMRQIGARQEAGRIGGIGSCGRELCCASWMSNFVSVTTNCARWQELSLNPQKLAGQCSKLKCCLNFEINSYIEAQKLFPDKETVLVTEKGNAYYSKTDVFKGIFWYSFDKDAAVNLTPVPVERVREIIELNKKNIVVPYLIEPENSIDIPDFTNDAGQDNIDRFLKKSNDKKKSRKRKNKKRKNNADK